MSATLNLGTDGNWATKKDTILAYNDENSNFKPLAFNYERDTLATRVNKDGLIETVGSGEPRIDYKDDSKGALLLEPSRSNLITYSEDFSQGYWTKSGSSVVSGFISPDGTANAYKLTKIGSGNSLVRLVSGLTNVSYTNSFYIKRVSGDGNISIILPNGTSEVVNIDNEWKRYSVTSLPSGGSGAFIGLILSETNDEVLIYGAQLEQGSYPTSYIPTQGSAVTRNNETCSDAGNDQVINSTEGVLFVHIKSLNITNLSQSVGVSDGTVSNRFDIRVNSSNVVSGVGVFGGVVAFSMGSYVASKSEELKIALSYKNNDFRLFINGVKNSEDTSGTVSGTFNELSLNLNDSQKMNSPISEIKLYNTALTDQELINLTTI